MLIFAVPLFEKRVSSLRIMEDKYKTNSISLRDQGDIRER